VTHSAVSYYFDQACNIFVKSRRAGERLMQNVTRYLRDSLQPTVNAQKSAVDRPGNRKFLGFTVSRDGARIKVADKAIEKLKDPIRELTRRTLGHRLSDIMQELKTALTGWKAYFGIAEVMSASAQIRQRGATAVTMLRMETMGQRGLPRVEETRGQRARSLEHKHKRAWSMAPEQYASLESGAACKNVSSNGAARVGKGQGSMRATMVQGIAEYVTRMSGGVGGRGREASSSPD
jgi:hypothetical protein